MENILQIELFGERYKFKTDLGPKQAEKVVKLLQNEISSIQDTQVNKSSGMNNVAILIIVALNIARENIELKNQNLKMMHQIFHRSEELIKHLDKSLEGKKKQNCYMNHPITNFVSNELFCEEPDQRDAGLY